jgi:hypothetical protein
MGGIINFSLANSLALIASSLIANGCSSGRQSTKNTENMNAKDRWWIDIRQWYLNIYHFLDKQNLIVTDFTYRQKRYFYVTLVSYITKEELHIL